MLVLTNPTTRKPQGSNKKQKYSIGCPSPKFIEYSASNIDCDLVIESQWNEAHSDILEREQDWIVDWLNRVFGFRRKFQFEFS